MLKNSAAAICSSTCSVPCSPCPSPGASTPRFRARFPPARRFQHRSLPKHRTSEPSRCYATRPPKPDDADPPSWPRSPHPTPYEIFGMQRGAPYTKRRFYQLVKLYHPDTRDADSLPAPSQQLSHAARLERYHLVVAANDLLSDPSKRRLYDHHGIGWTGGQRVPDLREADRTWRHQPGNASRNATWEDWEQWRNERNGKPSEPVYMSNGTFAALVVCMCMIGALAQMSRAEAAGEQHVDFAQQKDWAIGQKMRESTMASAGRTKDERVDTFLRDRENVSFDFRPGKYDAPPSRGSREG
ncbi:Heat shock protein DnaJ [Metarhizium album ARSEF 1941]|uniref:Heat shock protein DnaJ n=1 Tax=Metarhizium album (strain ARSEF 1941) TaxID=1081103 RepID=A0A0B2WW85_METAS|nr:Heat shock protein DnaJ [Metarhizium album ARSEF 1941]KHN97155.1 Heat shock protein DnaJ [Metarhizium album ARSEF 1941]